MADEVDDTDDGALVIEHVHDLTFAREHVLAERHGRHHHLHEGIRVGPVPPGTQHQLGDGRGLAGTGAPERGR